MAYYPFPATYQPFQAQPAPMYNANMMGPNMVQAQQPQQPPQMVNQAAQPAPSQSAMIWVPNYRAALEYPVGPNNAVALWDQNGNFVYLKTADASGKPNTRRFELVERQETVQETGASPDLPNPGYAAQKDLEALAGVVKGYSEMIVKMQGEIDRLTGDVSAISAQKEGTVNA